jgi:hypothetical protein
LKRFPKVQTDDRKLNLIQDAIVDAVNPLLVLPLSNSIYLQGIVLASGNNLINHGLGRELQGYIVTKKDADQSIYDNQQGNNLPDKTLLLVAGGACKVDLIVF